MERFPIDPLDTGLRNRCERRKRLAKLVRRILRNRRLLMVAISVVKAIVYLARLIGEVFNDS